MAAVALLAAMLGLPALARGATFAPARVDNVVMLRAYGLHGIACPAITQCTAISRLGEEVTFDPTSPAAPAAVLVGTYAPDDEAIACPSVTQCTAVDFGGAEVTFDPGAPSTAVRFLFGGGPLWSISCPSSSQCTAVGERDVEVTFNPASPAAAAPLRIGSGEGFLGVSCPAVTQCTAVTVTGEEVTFNPTAPGTPAAVIIDSRTRQGAPSPPALRVPLQGVACPTLTQCTAVDQTGTEVTFNPAAPGAPSSAAVTGSASERNAVACPSAAECTLVNAGVVATFDPAAPGAGTSFRWEANGGEISLACPSANQCTAVNIGEPTEGEALTFDPNPPSAAGGPPGEPRLPPGATGPALVLPEPPILSTVAQSHRRWRERGRVSKGAYGTPVGTTFSFTLNETANVSFTFAERAVGREVKGRCRVQSRANRRARRCERSAIRGELVVAGHAGVNRISFVGRLGRGRSLPPGGYTVLIAATSPAGLHSSATRLGLSVGG